MHWLITGGAGFIGSHLAERLIRKGESVVVIDDLSTGSASNLAEIRHHPRFGFYADGVENKFLLRELVDAADVVWALEKLSRSEATVGQVYNIGATEEISILDLANRVREMTESRSEVRLVPYEQAYEAGFEDMPRRIPDIGKVADAIGYRPTCGLGDILRDVVAFERSRPQDRNPQ
jgi:nucleoside-diphosphate-sugar epimerase